jgi:hypothetical protein
MEKILSNFFKVEFCQNLIFGSLYVLSIRNKTKFFETKKVGISSFDALINSFTG